MTRLRVVTACVFFFGSFCAVGCVNAAAYAGLVMRDLSGFGSRGQPDRTNIVLSMLFSFADLIFYPVGSSIDRWRFGSSSAWLPVSAIILIETLAAMAFVLVVLTVRRRLLLFRDTHSKQ